MDGFNNGGTEFIVRCLGTNEVNGPLDFSDVRKTNEFGIGGQSAFEISMAT
jgi:hypothetical protein